MGLGLFVDSTGSMAFENSKTTVNGKSHINLAIFLTEIPLLNEETLFIVSRLGFILKGFWSPLVLF